MVLTRSLQCPTRVYSKAPYDSALTDLLAGKTWALATSAGWVKRGAVDALSREAGKPAAVIDRIPDNPKVSDVLTLTEQLPKVDVLVALGGGSVIDCAKGLVALQALDGDQDMLMAHLKTGSPLPGEGFDPAPIIAVPTTSGTGSEVTPWGTIWGDDNVKFSLKDEKLYPVVSILDPHLCVSMPAWITLASGLDALSHAMEAVWNNNHTPLSDHMAMSAISQLRKNLPLVMENPQDVEARRQVQLAACVSGLAMGTTNTALAHSISYPFTAKHRMPHGFACSFTLGDVARYNLEENPVRLQPIAEGMGCAVEELADEIESWLEELGIGQYLTNYVKPEDADSFGNDLITRARAANNLREVDGTIARGLARSSLERYCR